MNYNNSARPLPVLLCLLMLLAGTRGKLDHDQAKVIEAMGAFDLENHDSKWLLDMQIGHHNLKLGVRVGACRSWIKEDQCRMSNKMGEESPEKESCFPSQTNPRVSCDTAFCSKNGNYASSEQGIYGIETEIFCKVGRSSHVLASLILAKKIARSIPEMGEFCLMDSESSFNQGLVVLRGNKMQVINLKVRTDEEVAMRDSSFEVTQVTVGEDLGFGRGVAVKVRNQDADTFRDISLPLERQFSVELSMEQVGISVPVKLLGELERQIVELYMPSNSCRLSGGKLKCREEIIFGGLSTAIFELHLKGNLVISLPLHLLLGTCSARECSFLMTGHHKMSVVTVGTVIWETLALQWDLNNKQLWFYRLNNQWASLYSDYQEDLKHKGFLIGLVTFSYHLIKYLVCFLLVLSLVSLLVNCIFRWRDLLKYIRGLLAKMKRNRGNPVEQNEQEDDFALSQPSSRRGRAIQRLPEELEDEI